MQMIHLVYLFTSPLFSLLLWFKGMYGVQTSPHINDNFYDPIIVPNYDNCYEIYSSLETYFTAYTLISLMNTGK